MNNSSRFRVSSIMLAVSSRNSPSRVSPSQQLTIIEQSGEDVGSMIRRLITCLTTVLIMGLLLAGPKAEAAWQQAADRSSKIAKPAVGAGDQ